MSLTVLLFKLNLEADEQIPPISLGYLAASTPRHDIRIIDGQKDSFDEKALVEYCRRNSVDVLGIQAMTKDLPASRKLLRFVKTALPDLITTVGGVQSSLMPQETLQFYGNSTDCVFAGESEIGFSRWLDALERDGSVGGDDIPGLVWRRNDGSIGLNQPEFINNLDDIPFPRWDLMPPASYPYAPHGGFLKQYPVAPIITSRGCPFSCTFCSAPVLCNRRIRFRKLDNIFAEINLLHDKYGVREIHIEDDNFSLRRSFVLAFCRRMRENGRAITWAFPNGIRLDTLDDEVLKAMRDAGAYLLNFGIESGDDETLIRIKKKLTTAQIREKVALARKYGFLTGGFFIIGFPWETEAHVKRTFRFARSLDLDHAAFSYYQPFPGTELSRELQERGEFAIDLESFPTSLHDITYVPKGITRQRLHRLRQFGLASYYFRPTTALGILRRVRSFEHLGYIVKRGIRWLAK
jgi:anaerobic magnesium-protoporphyrin IX monomethyl ester cyclase